jgi:hypothetical protein
VKKLNYLYLNHLAMRSIAMAAICIMILGSCKKKTETIIEDYLPLTVGSNWTYTSNGVSNKLTVTNKDTVALGRTYKVLSNSNGANQYQAKAGTEYYRLASFQGVLPAFDELYLKSDQDVNGTWQLAIPIVVSGFTIYVNSKYTITEKGVSKTVQGKTYNDVVHVHQDFNSPLGNNGTADWYYAKGIGLISSLVAITFPGQSFNNTTELTAYEIK